MGANRLTVYVDDMYLYPIGQYGRMKMSHMISDSEQELLIMADWIGIQRKWLQKKGQGRDREHFDICLSMRKKAVEAGAIEMTMHDMGLMCREWRK